MLVILLLVIIAFCCLLMNIAWSTCRLGISPTPSNLKMRKACLQTLEKCQTQNPALNHVIVAGSGWGGLAWHLAQSTQCSIDCFEDALLPWLWHRLNLHCRPGAGRNISLHKSQFSSQVFANTCTPNSVVVCYLYPRGTQQLYAQLINQLVDSQPNVCAGLISVAFAVNAVTPTSTLVCSDWMATPIYWYQFTN